MGGPARPADVHTFLTGWQVGPFPLGVLAGVAILAYWYVNGTRQLAERGRRWPPARTAAFLLGLVAVDMALQSAVATLAGSVFTFHVLQHLLLMVVAPPLLAMGAPMTLALQTSSRPTKSRLLRAVNSGPFVALTHPLPVWFLFYGVMFVFFLSPLIGFAMEHMAVMDVINLVFLGGATLFWWPIVSPDPIPHWGQSHPIRFANLLLGIPFESFLGIAIMSDKAPIAPMYTVSGTHTGGAVLWVLSELSIAVAIIPLYRQWTRVEERRAVRLDRRLMAALMTGRPVPVEASGAGSYWESYWVARTGGTPTFSVEPGALAPERVLSPPPVRAELGS